jgi:hypothetical protein
MLQAGAGLGSILASCVWLVLAQRSATVRYRGLTQYLRAVIFMILVHNHLPPSHSRTWIPLCQTKSRGIRKSFRDLIGPF